MINVDYKHCSKSQQKNILISQRLDENMPVTQLISSLKLSVAMSTLGTIVIQLEQWKGSTYYKSGIHQNRKSKIETGQISY
jgi:hypothetical protein